MFKIYSRCVSKESPIAPLGADLNNSKTDIHFRLFLKSTIALIQRYEITDMEKKCELYYVFLANLFIVRYSSLLLILYS